MKKLLAVVLTVVLCFSLVGCLGEEGPSKETNKPAEHQKAENLVFGLNETAVFEKLKFTATEIKESNGDAFFTPESGNIFVGINFTVENISDEEQSVSTILLFEGYADDIKCDYSFSASCAFSDGSLDGTIAPGKKLVGWYALEVPKDWSNIELNVQSDWLSNNSAKFVFEK